MAIPRPEDLLSFARGVQAPTMNNAKSTPAVAPEVLKPHIPRPTDLLTMAKSKAPAPSPAVPRPEELMAFAKGRAVTPNESMNIIGSRNETISPAPKKAGMAALYDEYVPDTIKNIASTLKKGIVGEEAIDIGGNTVQQSGLLVRGNDFGLADIIPFGSFRPKSELQRFNDRIAALQEKGIEENRAIEIAQAATGYGTSEAKDPVERIQKKETVDQRLKSLELNDDEKSALRKVGIWEFVDKAAGALDFVGVGAIKNIGKTAVQRIAATADEAVIAGILKKEIPKLDDRVREGFAKVFTQINDPKDVEVAFNRIKYQVSQPKKNPTPQELLDYVKGNTVRTDLKPIADDIGELQGQFLDDPENFDEALEARVIKGLEDSGYTYSVSDMQNDITIGVKTQDIKEAQKKIIDIAETIHGDIKIKANPDGTVTLYHGTDNKSAEAILKDGFEDGPYLSSSVEEDVAGVNGAKYYGDDVLEVTVDPRNLEFSVTGEFYNSGPTISVKKYGQKTPQAPAFEGFEDLSTTIINKLEGRSTVSKQFISDLTNSGEVKQAERDVIRKVLGDYPDGNISVKEFADKVKSELLPLKTGNGVGKFESVTLPDNIRGNVADYKENIYRSPISTSAGSVHFGNTKNYFAHTRIEDLAPENTGKYGSQILKQGAKFPDAGGSTRRVIELQSDLFQKGRLEGEIKNPVFDNMTPEELAEMRKYDPYNSKVFDEREARKLEIAKLEPYRNTWHERVIREEIKRAAQDGKTKLQFPTGETAMKIEGLGQNNSFYIYTGKYPMDVATPENIKVGMQLNQPTGDWIITDVLGDGKFKAVPSGGSIIDTDSAKALKEGRYSDIPDHHKESFDISGKVDTNNPIYKFYEKEVGRFLSNKYKAVRITDPQGVSWWQIDVSPDTAKKPVVAYQKYRISGKEFGLSKDEATKLFRELFDENEASIVFSKNLLDEGTLGRVTIDQDLYTKDYKAMVELLDNGGKVSKETLYHEAFHTFFNKYIPEGERTAMVKKVKDNFITREMMNETYSKKDYPSADQRAEEWLADDFANYVKSKSANSKYDGPFKRIWQKFIAKVRELIRKVGNFEKLYEDILNKKRPGKGNVETVRNQTVNDDDIIPSEIRAGNRAERLAAERGNIEYSRQIARQADEQALKYRDPKLQELKMQRDFLQDALDTNPAKELIRYTNKRTSELPEVTGEGFSVFRERGDDIVTELGFESSEDARRAVEDYKADQLRLKKLNQQILDLSIDERQKRNDIADKVFLDRMGAREAQRIDKIVGDETKKKEAAERVKKASEEASKKLASEMEYDSRYKALVEKAHTEAQKKVGLYGKIKAKLGPINHTDDVTKRIYEAWKAKHILSKEIANKTYDEFKNAEGDFIDIMEYQAGKKTPWIKEVFDDLYTQGKRRGLETYYRDDYIPQVYREKPEQIKKAIAEYLKDEGLEKGMIDSYLNGDKELPDKIAIRLKMRPSFIRKRSFPDYRTAMKYGLTPKFTTVPEHIAYYREEMEKAIANRELVDDLIKEGKLLDADDAPASWVEVKVPGTRRHWYGNKNLADALNGQFDSEDPGVLESITQFGAGLSSVMQSIKLSAGIPYTPLNFFAVGQAIKAGTTGIGALTKGKPAQAAAQARAAFAFLRSFSDAASIKWFKDNQRYINLMGEEGIDVANRVGNYDEMYRQIRDIWLNKDTYKTVSQSIKDGIEAVKNTPKRVRDEGFKKLPQTLFDLMRDGATSQGVEIAAAAFDQAFNKKTFSTMMPQMKIQIFKDAYEKAIKDGMGKKEAAAFAGSVTKKGFGIIDDLGRTKYTKNVLGTLFFAPKFRESLINVLRHAAEGSTFKFKDPSYADSRSFALGVIVTFGIYQLINWSINQEFTWENERGREFSIKLNVPDVVDKGNDEYMYIEFSPSVLAFPRNMISGLFAFAGGDTKTGIQKFSSVLSMPIKTGGEALANKDYFGRPIYDEGDSPKEMAQKVAKYVGLSFLHPYISEMYRYFKGQQPLYQALSIMAELPVKYSNSQKREANLYWEALDKMQARRKKYKDIITLEVEARKLTKDGKEEIAQTKIDALSDDEYEVYRAVKMIPTVQKVQKYVAEGKEDAAQMVVDGLDDEEYRLYEFARDNLTNPRKPESVKAEKPEFVDKTTTSEQTIIEMVSTYAQALGADPVTTFNRIFTGQRVRRVDNGVVIVERMPYKGPGSSSEVRNARGATPEMRLDHTIPLQLGGSNDESNLELIPIEQWERNSKVENYLGAQLKKKTLDKDTVQDLIIKFKRGEITEEEVRSFKN